MSSINNNIVIVPCMGLYTGKSKTR